MSSSQHDRAGDLFLEARELPAQERAAFLDRGCAGDDALRADVESLLEADEQASILENVPGIDLKAELQGLAEAELLPDGPDESLPERIGPYRIVRRVGQGGMGIVYEAEQQEPRRRVALKVIRRAFLSERLQSRFQLEAHLLGQLQHPGIAQIYEANTGSETGGQAPFFVMEFIEGQPLTTFAAAHDLTLEARLALFARVCDAVQHAHQKGIIHRDLKPANILVTNEASTSADAADTTLAAIGQPKILDFGIARLADANQASATLQTGVGELLGTISYMSPEQVSGQPMDVDTRSDVYALGVVLYELLAGRLPFQLHGQAITEAARTIAEKDAPRLGTLVPGCRGDIETIVGKAMAKERARRYASAHELATDVRRHLRSEPIEARAASTFYQLRKFAVRNKALVGGIVTTFIALVVGLIGTLYWAQQASDRQRQVQVVADFQGRMLEDVQVDEMGRQLLTELRADIARIVESADSEESPDIEQLLARMDVVGIASRLLDEQIVARASRAVDRAFAGQTETSAEIRASLGRVYSSLGLYEQALTEYELASELWQEVHGVDDARAVLARRDAGHALGMAGRYADAEAALRIAFDDLRRTLGEAHPDTIRTLERIGDMHINLSQFEEAARTLQEALDLAEQHLGPQHQQTLNILSLLGNMHRANSRLDEAEVLLREAHARAQASLGDAHVDTLSRQKELALLFMMRRMYAEAEPLLVDVVAGHRAQLGDDHPDTLSSTHSLGELYSYLRRFEESEPLLRSALEGRRRILGPTHPSVLRSLNALSGTLMRTDRRSEALEVLYEARTIAHATLGRWNNTTSVVAINLATVLKEQGAFEAAARFAQEAHEIRVEIYGADNYRTLIAMRVRCEVLLAEGRYAKAAELLESMRASIGEVDALRGPMYSAVVSKLAYAYTGDGRADLGEPFARELLEICSEGETPNLTVVGMAERVLAFTLLPQGKLDAALALLEDAETHMRGGLPEDHFHILYARALKAAALCARARTGDAEQVLVDAVDAVLGQIEGFAIDERALIQATLQQHLEACRSQ